MACSVCIKERKINPFFWFQKEEKKLFIAKSTKKRICFSHEKKEDENFNKNKNKMEKKELHLHHHHHHHQNYETDK